MENDLKRSQGACEQLDEAVGQDTPTVPWFWLSTPGRPDEEDDSSSDTSDAEELTVR